jgi:hypothetical protein
MWKLGWQKASARHRRTLHSLGDHLASKETAGKSRDSFGGILGSLSPHTAPRALRANATMATILPRLMLGFPSLRIGIDCSLALMAR